MLSNRGSINLSFLVTFLIIFLLCGIFCAVFLYENNLFSRDKNAKISSKDNNYEKKLEEATGKYVNDYYPDLKNGERLIIKLSTLSNNDYIHLDDCKGYSLVEKQTNLIIDSYVSCNDYESENYDSEHE